LEIPADSAMSQRKLSVKPGSGLAFGPCMLHENAALAVDSPPGYAKFEIIHRSV
jgi:hypothetical protein